MPPARNVSSAGTAATPNESDARTLSPSTNKMSAAALLTSLPLETHSQTRCLRRSRKGFVNVRREPDGPVGGARGVS
jgi:hypothetical protein